MTTISSMPLKGKSYWIVAVSSMEQVIGAALSTIIGVMLPMMQLLQHTEMASWLQGIIGAMGLIGIAIGSAIIGKLADRHGYLLWFRICPALIVAGACLCWLVPVRWALIAGMFLAGFGVGGGYSLDSAYISELLPKKWGTLMVGVAKATSAVGFLGAAVYCWLVLRVDPDPEIWNEMAILMAALGVLTLLMRLHWAESPDWLMERGERDKAVKAIEVFFGKNSGIEPQQPQQTERSKPVSWASMFKGENLKRVIFSGVPWACEGLGVYGFGVFLPILMMTLGLDRASSAGIEKIVDSVELTAVVNFSILPGFIIGLLILNRFNHVKILSWGFVVSAVGLGILLAGYLLKLPKPVLIGGFVVFEIALNCGPHLITFVIPSAIFPVSNRSTGSGIAATMGKIGAIIGVIVMPLMISAGGAELVLVVSIAVMLMGALISVIYGRILGLLGPKK